MENFKNLFMIQLKEKLDLSYLKSVKKTAFKIVFYLLGFAAAIAFSYLIFWLCQFFNLFSALGDIPRSFMTLIFVILFFINVISSTIGLSKTLYYFKDNQFLVTLPVSPNEIFLSKMLVYLISEVKKTFILQIPIFIGYGIISKLSFGYYPWVILMLVILTLIPVLLGGILSIPTNYIMRFLNRFSFLKVVLAICLLTAITLITITLINKIPANINLIRSWTVVSEFIRNLLKQFTVGFFYPFYCLTLFLCGTYENRINHLFSNYTWIVLLIVIALIALLLVANAFASRPLYLKMITRSFEFNKVEKQKVKHNKGFNDTFSTCLYESLRQFKNPTKLSYSIAFAIITPIAVLLLNRIYSAIDTNLSGQNLTIAFNALVIALFITISNVYVSSIYSYDAEALILNKTKPQHPFKVLLPRLAYNIFFSIVILTASSIVFFTFSKMAVVDCIFFYFSMLFIILTHIIWSADIDFTHPQVQLFKENGSVAFNPNEVKSSIVALVLSVAGFGITYFFLFDKLNLVWLRLTIIFALLLAVRMYLFTSKSRELYQELAE